MPQPPRQPADDSPYCTNCGYDLAGTTESARCPECGRPLIEVLGRRSFQRWGRRYESKARIFGMPLISIAQGPHGNEPRGRARGFIAMGDTAVGFIAMGGMTRGVVAFGGVNVGVFAFGGFNAGIVSAGGFALGALMGIGGLAVGGIANGGFGAGVIASGGMAIGMYARGGMAIGAHVIRGGAPPDPEAVRVFSDLYWLVGDPSPFGMLIPVVWILVPVIIVVIALLAIARIVVGGDAFDEAVRASRRGVPDAGDSAAQAQNLGGPS